MHEEAKYQRHCIGQRPAVTRSTKRINLNVGNEMCVEELQ